MGRTATSVNPETVIARVGRMLDEFPEVTPECDCCKNIEEKEDATSECTIFRSPKHETCKKGGCRCRKV